MWIFLAASLVASASAIADLNCTSNGVYTEQAVACENSYSDAACASVYKNLTAVTSGGADERPVECFNGTTGPSEEMKQMAIANCPKTCGFCCQTKEYNCQNAAPNKARINCGTVSRAMCKDPSWRQIIAEDCPAACGFCLAGGCVDAAPECASQATICKIIGMEDFVAKNCQRTCGLCSGTTYPGQPGTGGCVDASTSCANWVKNGFCTNAFYSVADRKKYCAKSCNVCNQ